MPVKILHIVSGSTRGGAARGAYWLHTELRNQGVESQILNNTYVKDFDNSVSTILTGPRKKLAQYIYTRLDQVILKLYKKRKKSIFSPALLGLNIHKHPLYNWADIIHLHWINNGFVNISQLSKIKKPIVWTLRDMWPFTGGCHYSMNCKKFMAGCGNCTHLNSNKTHDLSHFLVQQKRKHYTKNIHFVGISNWISFEAQNSYLLKEYKVKTIYNNVNCSSFKPIDKNTAKEILGLDLNKKVILTGAQSLNDSYKGFDKYLETVKLLKDKQDYLFAFFGNLDKKLFKNLNIDYKSFGFITGDISLRLIYSAADVFIAPSIEEAFGKTLAEAMACGTPVVCFDSTGPKDIVDHLINGYKAEPYSNNDLKKGIEWVLQNEHYKKLCKEARKKAVSAFDTKLISSQYIELYQEILNQEC